MKIRITRKDDALYVRFSSEVIAETAEVSPGVMFDYDANGRIVSFEFLDASNTLAGADMKKVDVEVV